MDAFTLVALLVRNRCTANFLQCLFAQLFFFRLQDRGVSKIEVSISEANQQFASYERTILA